MADLNPLVVNPDNIRALNDTLKIVGGGIVSVAAAISAIYTVISSRRTKIVKTNSELTAVNTEALVSHSKDLCDFKESQAKEMEGLRHDLQELKTDLVIELNKIKIVVAKVSNSTDQKLGMIPKIQDALTVIERRRLDEEFKNAQRDEKLDKFIAGMERISKRGNGG